MRWLSKNCLPLHAFLLRSGLQWHKILRRNGAESKLWLCFGIKLSLGWVPILVKIHEMINSTLHQFHQHFPPSLHRLLSSFSRPGWYHIPESSLNSWNLDTLQTFLNVGFTLCRIFCSFLYALHGGVSTWTCNFHPRLFSPYLTALACPHQFLE